MAYDLFNPAPDNIINLLNYPTSKVVNDIAAIHGLTYIPNFITKETERTLINSINSESWLTDIKRRVQHYGYKYDYKARSIDYSMFLGELPIWSQSIAHRLYAENFIEDMPDQLIVNEYLPGQGITSHVDCKPCFSGTIISLSLGSGCIMDFVSLLTNKKIEVFIEPCSLVVISGESRYNWTHGIAPRKTDYFKGLKLDRTTRVSMTFRKVILR